MANLIPPIDTRGIYILKPPFDVSLQPATLYRCAAIRNFKDIENNGVNVFETYYVNRNISQADYEKDRRDGVKIITLITDAYAPVYVPSSYIASYPDFGTRNYQRVVLSVDLGPLPDVLDLGFVKSKIAEDVHQSFGVKPVVNVAIAPMSGVVTTEQSDARETARQSAIRNSTTDYGLLVKEREKNALLAQRCAVLEQLVRDKGLLD